MAEQIDLPAHLKKDGDHIFYGSLEEQERKKREMVQKLEEKKEKDEDEDESMSSGSDDDEDMVLGDEAIQKAIAAGNINIDGMNVQEMELSEANRQRVEMQDAVIAEREKKKMAATIAVPTDPAVVKTRLRQLGHPVTLFGEGPAERRKRLTQIMVDKVVEEGMDIADVMVEGLSREELQQETAQPAVNRFKEAILTEGAKDLPQHRLFLAQYSLRRAKLRVAAEKERGVQDIWDPPTMEKITTLCSVSSCIAGKRPLANIKFTRDGQHLVTVSWGGEVQLWNRDHDRPVRIFEGHEDRLVGLAVHPDCAIADPLLPPANPELAALSAKDPTDADGRLAFATGCAAGLIRLWSIGSVAALSTMKGHLSRVNRMTFHPCGKYLASTSHDKTWRLWDVEKACELASHEGHSRACYDVSFHPDGSLTATTGLDCLSRLWDLRSGRNIHTFQGHVKQSLASQFLPNGYHLLTGADDHLVKLWDLRMRRCVYSIPAHQNLISKIAVEPNGRFFVTASYDHKLKVWSTKDFALQATLGAHEEKVMNVDVSIADGTPRLATACYDRTWRLWEPADIF